MFEELNDVKEAINFKRNLVGVLGRPVLENPTELMIRAAFKHHDMAWRYLTIDVASEDLGDAVRGARAMGFTGFNCTTPHKVSVIEYLDELSDTARLIGAVNCVVVRNGRLIGENTDGKGFVAALGDDVEIAKKHLVVFGAGGAARAIAVEMALAGARKITVVNRSPDRGESMVSDLQKKFAQALVSPPQIELRKLHPGFNVPDAADIVVNATTVGLYPHITGELPINFGSLLPNMVVADVIPNPPRTRLLELANQRGCKTVDGLGMLVEQGRIGVELWSGICPQATTMRAALEAFFSEGQY